MTRLNTSYANRGMGLETMISMTNDIYKNCGLAVVTKMPIPVKIKRMNGNQIREAFIQAKSTVDYVGVYRGHSLQFEAKSTRELTRFDLKNFHQHQVDHMRACVSQGAIVFTVLEFAKLDETFYLPAKMLINAWDKHQAGGPASIPYAEICEQCAHVLASRGVPLDYLKVIDDLYFPVNKRMVSHR